MYKKSIFTLILLSIYCTLTFAQEKETETQTVLSAPANWQSEIIHFPMGFAQSIDFVGFEDLRFAPGWSDSTSHEFWTYTFVWYIEKYGPMTEQKLTESFNSYYDGLMGIDMRNNADTTNSKQLKKTHSLFTKNSEGFSGEMRVFDAFFTKEYMTLNIKVEESFCSTTNKQIVFCYISPQAFDHKVWAIFDDVELTVTCE